jgi:hypothetical protein
MGIFLLSPFTSRRPNVVFSSARPGCRSGRLGDAAKSCPRSRLRWCGRCDSREETIIQMRRVSRWVDWAESAGDGSASVPSKTSEEDV